MPTVVDLMLLHPPSVLDFRERVMFTGPLASLVPEYTHAFTAFPVGFISIANQLKEAGYRVRIANLGLRMLTNKRFDLKAFLKKSEATSIGIDLHWCVHSHGAIEVARICKQLNPNLNVILGGLTATRFDIEILREFPFIDLIIRGEGEIPALKLLETLERNGDLARVPNITYRDHNGKINRSYFSKPIERLDELEFADLSVLESEDLYHVRKLASWWLPVCRGCSYTCVTCGGSAYSYRLLCNRERLAPRSPARLVEDLQKLSELGIKRVFLFQDIRMCGRNFQEEFLEKFRAESPDLDAITLELFSPANEEFIKGLSSLGTNIFLTISPESGSEKVRRAHGRRYSNQELLETVKLCQAYGLKLGVFFMIGLAEEKFSTMPETLKLCNEILKLSGYPSISLGCMLLLDPGSSGFDNPSNHGYKLLFRGFMDYYTALLNPSWKYFISYETKNLSRESIVQLFLTALDKYAELLARRSWNRLAYALRSEVCMEKYILGEVDRIMKIPDQEERGNRLEELLDAVKMYKSILRGGGLASRVKWGLSALSDPYGFKRELGRLLRSYPSLLL